LVVISAPRFLCLSHHDYPVVLVVFREADLDYCHTEVPETVVAEAVLIVRLVLEVVDHRLMLTR
jgi:hypothetical protein